MRSLTIIKGIRQTELFKKYSLTPNLQSNQISLSAGSNRKTVENYQKVSFETSITAL